MLPRGVAYLTIGLDDGPPVLRHVHRKNFLPTYGLFDEERFVERGTDIRAFETPWGRAAMLVCEDAWHSMAGMIAALDGAGQVEFEHDLLTLANEHNAAGTGGLRFASEYAEVVAVRA